jgi:hypothetical protein
MWLDIDISVMSNASSLSARRKISSGSPGSALMRAGDRDAAVEDRPGAVGRHARHSHIKYRHEGSKGNARNRTYVLCSDPEVRKHSRHGRANFGFGH